MRPRRLPLFVGGTLAAMAVPAAAGATVPPTTAPCETPDATTATSDAAKTCQPVIDPGDGGDYQVEIDPGDFSPAVDNPYLPLRPGTRWVYEATGADGEIEVITVEVLDELRTVMGVETIVVRDVVATEDGEVVEDTYDWYAQDADGNVWYFGEDTTAYEEGVASDDGSWEAGVDGALPGFVMPAEPTVSDTGYRQEYLAGEAEDMGQVIATTGEVTVAAGTYDDVIVTRDWTPLEPETVEEKTYARDVGFVYETKPIGPDAGAVVELVEFTPLD